jgi:BirA family biotin operon repressor/biotin-[acetyl-CoA-carboxylase] ligase
LKHKIIKILHQNKGKYVSGEEIAKALSISRAAVKKHIDWLIASGWDITALKKCGYSLRETGDIFDEYSLRLYFDIYKIDIDITFLKSVDSTNNEAKKLQQRSKEGIVAAAIQTNGKGRKGRQFVSAKGGLYVSYYCHPENLSPFDAVKAVISAAAAANKTVKSTGAESGIKWANDIYSCGKKVCGILCEMVTEGEKAAFLVQGIGINVSNKIEGELSAFASDLETITGKKFCRAEICAVLIKNLIECNNMLIRDFNSLLKYYKENCITLGKKVTVYDSGEYEGIATEIDENGFLIVNTQRGIKTVTYGDVSVKIDNQ